MTTTIHIAGPNAEALAAELESFFVEALGAVPERRLPPEDREAKRGDPVAIAALVLAVPGAIVATLDLAARARLGERIDQLLTRLRGTAAPDDRVSLVSGTTPPLDLTTAGRDAVLDRLERPSDTD